MAPSHPEIVQGRLDLRGWNFATSQPLALNGQWEFHPSVWLANNNKDTDTLSSDSTYLSVPENWASSLSPHKASNYGYGSYRLRIQIDPDENRIYSLRLNSISSASELFINGRLLAQSGIPADSGNQYSPKNVPYTASFTVNSNEIDLIIQVANFLNPSSGGIDRSITFGSLAAVNKETNFSIGAQLSVCLVLFLHAVYAFVLYIFGVRQKALFYFTMLNLCSIMSVLIVDDKMLLAWFPINYEWEVKINNWSYLGTALFLLIYVKQLLLPRAKIRFVQVYVWLCLVYFILILFAPANLLYELNNLNIFMVSLPFLIAPVIAWQAVRRGEPDAIFIFLGMIGFLNNMLLSIPKEIGWSHAVYYPMDLVISFFVFATYWFKSYLRSSAQTAKLADQLVKADKLKDDFLVNTSHELRNPLHGILTIAQTIMDNEDKDQLSNKENMKLLISVGKRMSYLLNDLLDLTRLRENRIRLHMTPISVQTITSGIISMTRVLAEGKPLQLNNQIPEKFPLVIADENRLIQILFNLLHNAMKFTDEGSITVSAHEKDGFAYIHVSDTGIGMDKETSRTIFLPYEQGPFEHFNPSGGIGLGLSICKQLVELHGGTISVSSAPGEGSTFIFSLRLADISAPELMKTAMLAHPETAAAQATASVDIPEPYYVADRPSILAVDDDPTNLSILVGALSLDHYDIVTAISGQEALSLLNSREWDLVITDVMMPRMSGYELCLAIRERFTAAELPVLLLTARARTEDLEAGFQAGANDYVMKPVEPMELKSRVKALTALRKSVSDKMRMEAAWLQAQIKPHFLFNTLNSVASLSDFDTARMRKLIEAFSQYLRASFANRNLERIVPLEVELELVRSYLYIEKERFEERLQVIWEIDKFDSLMLPPLSIQPLVENAVRHGVLRQVSGVEVQIRITNHVQFAMISIIDNGAGMNTETLQRVLEQPKDTKGGIGLPNTHRRLKQLYGEGLTISSELYKGTTVTFIVPLSHK
ncbi:hypothetical protein KCTCHS21_45570 [Cohnella abietis]|uniref:histidine kinase n=2 Tax=Cohnella abietis TaxID=2507935 RepID=A0A3T1DB06_9BACL|nr:hypothetical protein KCTCHS21_45570 [Cohnella abietis]